MREHGCRRTLAAEADRALDLARTTLAAAGFRVGPVQGGELVATGGVPGSSRRNPLSFASRIRVRAAGGELELRAELGGLRWMQRFIWIFPFALAALLSATFWLLQRLGAMPGGALGVPFLAVSPWLVLSPLMSAWLRRRTVEAIERLADSLATA